MQNSELTRIKNIIRALSQKTMDNGCTEAEAFFAMEKIGKLLEQYNLSMTEVDLKEENCVTEIYITRQRTRSEVVGVAMAIAYFCDCKVWKSTPGEGNLQIHYFGMESDVQMAMYLSKIVEVATASELEKFKKTMGYRTARSKRSATISFQHGMSSRLSTRLNEMKDSYKNQTSSGSSKSLVIVKNGIIEDQFKNLQLRMKKNYNKARVHDYSAYASGQQSANTVNLNRPITSNGGYKYVAIA